MQPCHGFLHGLATHASSYQSHQEAGSMHRVDITPRMQLVKLHIKWVELWFEVERVRALVIKEQTDGAFRCTSTDPHLGE
jgi:hypothetical protein